MKNVFLMRLIEEVRKQLNIDINVVKNVKGGVEIYKTTLIEYVKALFNELRNNIVNELQNNTLEQTIEKVRKIIDKVEEIVE